MVPPIEIPQDRPVNSTTGPTATSSITIVMGPDADGVTVQYHTPLTMTDAVTGAVIRTENLHFDTVGDQFTRSLNVPLFDPVTRTPIPGKSISTDDLRYHVWCYTRHMLGVKYGGQDYADVVAGLNNDNSGV